MEMKARINRGNGFRGAMDYLMLEPKPENPPPDWKPSPRPGAEIIGGNLSGKTPRALAREFSASRKLRPDCKNPVWHCSLSMPPGESISPEKWNEISEKFLVKMGINPENHQYSIVRHLDHDHDHVHIVASRIGLNSELWYGKKDVFNAITATQELEMELGLTLTPGFSGPADEKKLSKNETEMSLRTGQLAPRRRLQQIVTEAAADRPTAPEFMENLMLAGVGVRANIASTGRMSGFGFEIDGIPFKASQLGKKYSWKNLSHEVEYVENRDAETIRALNALQSAVTGGQRTPAAETINSSIRELAGLAGSNRQRADGTAEALRGNAETTGRAYSGAAGSDQRADDRDSNLSDGGDGADHRSAANPDPGPGAGSGPDTCPGKQFRRSPERSERNNFGDQADDLGSGGIDGGLGQGDQAPGEQSPGHRSGDRSDFQPAHIDRDSIHAENLEMASIMSWNDRFKKASAAHRRAAAGPVPAPVPAHEIQSARAVDPKPILEKYGFEVRSVGKQYSIRQGGDEIFRSTNKNGHWVHCDHYGGGIGDNIALIQHIDPSKNFADTVFELHGAPAFQPQPIPDLKKLRPLLPACNSWAEARGRDYLLDRGISIDTINAAENCGFLAYTMDGILIIGRDPQCGEVRAITRRAIDDNAEMPKRDLRHTNKVDFPPVLPGTGAAVVIVEGGGDALAVHDMCKKQNRPLPTVIVSGSAEAQGFLEQPHVQKILKAAEKITVCYENEPKESIQKKTDAAHDKQLSRIREIVPSGSTVQAWRPGPGCKDAADVNEAMVIEPDPASKPEQDYDNGPSLAK
jgi:hypothetical protein